MDRFSKYRKISGLRGEVCDLELVSRLHLADGTVQEESHVRRAVCKKAVRKPGVTELTFADIDRDALQRVFPFESFSVADFPEVYIDHVGRPIPQGVGTVVKVPLAWITKSGGAWKYAGPKVIGPPGTVLAVYRGDRPGEGALVDASEFTTGTATGASSGVQVLTVNFTREQIDFQGRPYVIEADIVLPGSRYAADEIARLLALYGLTTHAASFTAAATYDATQSIVIDALYGAEKGRTGNSIIEDLLRVARAWLSQTDSGAWALVQDSPKVSSKQFDTFADEIAIEEYGDGADIGKTVSVEYRPRASGGEDFTGNLPPQTTGEVVQRFPYVRDHVVADKLRSYWQKRLDTLHEAKGSIHASHLVNGDLITITDTVIWNGAKDLILTGITRPGDRNDVVLREYDAAVYVYTAGTLPADATNTYSPDYSFTRPAAPTGLQVVSQGTQVDTDGKVTAYALIRATPPTVNWQRLMAQVEDTGTKEVYQAQLQLAAGNYEITVSGLRPNRAHVVRAWAVNANNVDGFATADVPFTSANSSLLPSAPAVVVVDQTQSFEVNVSWSKVSDVVGNPPIRQYVVENSIGGGNWSEIYRGDGVSTKRTGISHGTTIQCRVKTIDANKNESSSSTLSNVFTPAAVVNDGYVQPQGINTGSIGLSAITNNRLAGSSVSQAKIGWAYVINNFLNVPPGGIAGIGSTGVALLPVVTATGPCAIVATPGGTAMGAQNTGGGLINITVNDPVMT